MVVVCSMPGVFYCLKKRGLTLKICTCFVLLYYISVVLTEYHPSKQSPAISALCLTRLQLSGTNSLFLSHSTSVSSFKSSLKTFLFSKTFSSVPLPWYAAVHVFLSVSLPLSVLLSLPWKPFCFQKPFLQSHCPDMRLCMCFCHCTSVNSFKSSLKTFLFLKTFSSVPLPWYAAVHVFLSLYLCPFF